MLNFIRNLFKNEYRVLFSKRVRFVGLSAKPLGRDNEFYVEKKAPFGKWKEIKECSSVEHTWMWERHKYVFTLNSFPKIEDAIKFAHKHSAIGNRAFYEEVENATFDPELSVYLGKLPNDKTEKMIT